MSRQLDLFGRPVPEKVKRGPGRPPLPRARPEDVLVGGAEEVLSAVRLPVVSHSALTAQLLQRVSELENRLSGADGPIFHDHYHKSEGKEEEEEEERPARRSAPGHTRE